ncbi:probable serine/threonine-protein kinase DDB_G0282963 [Condylostylus longicornis]|uniref:probable serine/threonine-protein kinase DDB_G0282963 n=1 Tax=Condylostylus longicornis TaxID=2530218 RepID=UPI00244E09F6|nr:probable serine/threonine-protein kinase DDB_G0282963 [Condylostylus longicornis]XP_055376685.1 probable serine/threonine-protein kinase DDB_G0282963 [Condylostylus longicornis]XP_055376686.1 probable serine/threonine-protein kinase DDB_G0282963 [Condylostylus longicornis]
MESIVQQQQNHQYNIPSTTIEKADINTTENITTFSDAITNNDNNAYISTTKAISTTTTVTNTNITECINTTNENYQNKSFHSKNSNCNTNETNTNSNTILQEQLKPQNDHANSSNIDDSNDDVNKFEYNKINIKYDDDDGNNNDNDDDDDDKKNSIKLENKNNNTHKLIADGKNIDKIYKINATNDDETIENFMRKSSSSSTTNLRLNFPKSHTCGSLFANCNCDSSKINLITKSAAQDFSTTKKSIIVTNSNEKKLKNNQINNDEITTKNSNKSLLQNDNIEYNLNLIDANESSISSQKFLNLNLLKDNCSNNFQATEEKILKTITTTQQTKPQQDQNNCCFLPNSKNENDNLILKKNQNDNNPSYSSSGLKTVKPDGCILRKTSQQNKSLNNCKRKNRKIFQSFCHPDTSFIFTDENCNPNLSNSNNQIRTIITKSGNICVKHPKRSSSPNIGNFTILDVHPEVLVKIHKSDPNLKRIDKKSSIESQSSVSSIDSSITTSSSSSTSLCSIKSNTNNIERKIQLNSENLLNSEKNIEQSENSFITQKSHVNVNRKNSVDLNNFKEINYKISPKLSLPNLPIEQININNIVNIKDKKLELNCLPNGKPHSNSESEKFSNSELKNSKLESAQKYFQESGILGPNIKAEKVNKLIRKTSKIIQDSNFIEHVRKNSKIILCNSPTPIKKTIKIMNEDENNTIKGNNFLENTISELCDKGVNNTTTTNMNFNKFENNSQLNIENQQQHQNIFEKLNNDSELNCCNCNKRIKILTEEIDNLKEIINRRDTEIHKLKREIHKLKSVLQQTNVNQILLNEKNIFQQKHQNNYRQQNTVVAAGTSSSSSTIQNSSNHHHHHSHHHHQHHQLQHGKQENSIITDYDSTDNSKLINGEYNYVGLVGAPSIIKSNYDKKLIKAKSHDQDTLLKDKNNLENTCSLCISKRSSYQPTTAPVVVVKKQGVSGESCDATNNRSQNIPIPKYEKDFRSKQLIKDAIMDNDFLKNIDSTQVRELVESMYNLDVANGEFVIREGDIGSHLYVSAEGHFEVIKNDIVLGTMGPGKAFGELAILYNCTRTASIRVISDDARVWVLDRRIFQQIMMRTGMQRIEENIRFLKSVPLLKNLSSDVLAKIADVLEVEFYPAGTYIIRQGASGDTFFLISQGTVKVTQKLGNLQEEKEIRTLQRGDYFGEQALINVDKRTANIIAMTPGVECLTLDRDSFNHLIGDLCELKEKNYGDENRILAMKFSDEKEIKVFGTNIVQEFPELKLTDLEIVATLGIGGFGRVELIKCYHENRIATYALKCLKKKHIIDTRQEEHVFSERTIMLTCKSPFICRLYRTFRDEKYLYMLLEACMGGEVWTMLRDRGNFNEEQTQFITGCVLQAFEYLHSRNIIYRDLKPENLMLSEQGYVKLVDFGFAKYIGNSQKTWTFCGTPEYVAPEIILNKGHDRAVDYWALGILIHELLNGTPPFTANDPMKTYNIILKGIDMIDFPKHMPKSAVTLIKKLCRDVPAERLGYSKGGIEDIKKHKWFQGFDWDSLANLTLIPPFLRPVTNPLDTSYFDKFPADTDIPPDETSGWDSDF